MPFSKDPTNGDERTSEDDTKEIVGIPSAPGNVPSRPTEPVYGHPTIGAEAPITKSRIDGIQNQPGNQRGSNRTGNGKGRHGDTGSSSPSSPPVVQDASQTQWSRDVGNMNDAASRQQRPAWWSDGRPENQADNTRDQAKRRPKTPEEIKDLTALFVVILGFSLVFAGSWITWGIGPAVLILGIMFVLVGILFGVNVTKDEK